MLKERIAKSKHGKAKNRSKMEYLLSGKMYCGACGSAIVGVSGNNRHGNTFYYYSCMGRKAKNGCSKVHEKKEFLERYIVEKTMKYVFNPKHMKEIAEGVVDQYNKEFNNEKINELEKKILKLDHKIRVYKSECIWIHMLSCKNSRQQPPEKLSLQSSELPTKPD